MSAPPRAFLFDVFGTLVDWRTSVARAVEHALPGMDADAFADAWRARYAPSMAPISAGKRPYVDLDTLHLENQNAVLADRGMTLSETEAQALNTAWHRLDPWGDVVEGLYRLKTLGLIAPCSNGSIALMARLARHAHLPWDTILGAEIAQSYKPDPKVYLSNCAALGLAPSEVMFVAAHNGDLKAAAECGLRTAFVLRPTEHGPAQTTDLAPTGPWDHVVPDLPALAKALNG